MQKLGRQLKTVLKQIKAKVENPQRVDPVRQTPLTLRKKSA